MDRSVGMRVGDDPAIDFIPKPAARAIGRSFEISDDLVEQMKVAGPGRARGIAPAPAVELAGRRRVADAVVIGISTGGPQVLRYLLSQIPADFRAAIAIVLHMPIGYTGLYAAKLNEIAPIRVMEAYEGAVMRPGVALLAQAGQHLSLARHADHQIVAHLDARPFDTPHCPAIDVLFRSAAEVYRDRLLGVVMTGMGSDGLLGAAQIKAQGGWIFTEAAESCVVYGMPRAVAEAGLSDRAAPVERMAQAIMEMV